MKDDIKVVSALPDHRLQVELEDGRSGVFDLRPYLGQPGLSALQDPAYFARVSVLYGAPTWPDGEDIAPSTIAVGIQMTTPA